MNDTSSATEETPAPTPPKPERGWLARRLSSENPFYVLSAAFVIHSTGLSLRQQDAALPILVLVGLIAGYLLLLVGIGVFIVRVWKVWDDARTIPLILVLLMLELSLCFDDLLMHAPSRAAAWLAGVSLFSVAVSEGVIRGLRLRLPWRYRGPFYVQMLIFLLAGVVVSAVARTGTESAVRWTIYGLSLVCGLSMLTLIPAVRSGPASVATWNCPWIWPIHPWSLFVVVWLCLGFRLYLVTLSFDPAVELDYVAANQQLQGIFSAYLLVPMLLGIGWLMLEAGEAHRSQLMRIGGLVTPGLAVLLSFSPDALNPAARMFLTEFTETIGSPVWCAAWAALLIYFGGLLRGIPYAGRCLLMTLLVLAWIGPRTVTVGTLSEFDPRPWLPVLVVLVAVGLWRGRSVAVFEGLVWGAFAAWNLGWMNGFIVSPLAVLAHVIVILSILTALCFRDRFAEFLSEMTTMFFLPAVPVMTVASLLGAFPGWLPPVYLLCLALLAWLLDRAREGWGFRGLALFAVGGTYVSGYVEGWRGLQLVVAWNGLWEFAVGIALLHLGLLASGLKGGCWSRLMRQLFPEVRAHRRRPELASGDDAFIIGTGSG